MWNKTKATELLKIKYPIIQGPFGGKFSSSRLVSTVSNLGGMGSFGLNSYAPEEILEVDKEIKRLTDETYALNLWVPLKNDPIQEYKEGNFNELKKAFAPYFDKMKVSIPTKLQGKTQDFEKQLEAVLESRPPVASFIFGIPPKEVIAELKKRKILVMATVTTLEEAVMVEEVGIDLVIASGLEAGGHRASFAKSAQDSLTSTRSLTDQVVKNVNLPVISAGGISNGKDITKMLKLGAGAAQIGTAFLATEESNASDIHKSKLLSSKLIKTDLTKVFTGRLARTISTSLSENFREVDAEFIAPYPLQSSFLAPLRKASIEQNKLEFVAFWSGQPSSVLTHKYASTLFDSFIQEISELI